MRRAGTCPGAAILHTYIAVTAIFTDFEYVPDEITLFSSYCAIVHELREIVVRGSRDPRRFKTNCKL